MADKSLEEFLFIVTTPSSKTPAESLPHFDELRIWAGRGSGKTCAHCHRPILAEDIEYEVLMPQSGTVSNAGESVLRLHLRCHDEWRTLHDAQGATR